MLPFSPPPVNLASLRSERWVPIGFRGRGVPSGNAYDSTNGFVMDQQAYQAPSWGTVTAIKLVYPGFDMDVYGEVQRGPTATIKAAVVNKATPISTLAVNAASSSGATTLSFANTIGAGLRPGMYVAGTGVPTNTVVTAVLPTYNAGGACTGITVTLSAPLTAAVASGANFNFLYIVAPATFGGQTTGVLAPRNDYLISDEIGIALTPGQAFYGRTYSQLSAPGIVLQGGPNDLQVAGDACQRTAAANDQALSYVNPTHTGAGYFGPVAILAKVSAPVPAVLVLGDSILFGVGDNTPDAFGRIGWFQRSVTNQIAWMSLARSGMALSFSGKQTAGTVAALKLASFTDVVIGLVRNDLGFATPAQVKTRLADMAAPYLAAGKRVWVVTSPPTTTSSDGWTSLANQTISDTTRETNRLGYNADIRANWQSYGYSGLFDIAAVIESTDSPGKWATGAGNVAWTTDGVHPSGAGYSAIVAAGVVKPSTFSLR